MAVPLRRKKFKTFLFLFVDKVPTAIKLAGGRGKALMALTSKKELFCGFPK